MAPYTMVLRSNQGKTVLVRGIQGKEACDRAAEVLNSSHDITKAECFQ